MTDVTPTKVVKNGKRFRLSLHPNIQYASSPNCSLYIFYCTYKDKFYDNQ